MGMNTMSLRPFIKRSIAAAAIAFSVAIASANADDARIAALQTKFRCPIFEYLSAIHAARLKLKHRFLIAEIANPKAAYFTQCIFYGRDRKVHCEAESPFYNSDLIAYFTPERLAVLKSLGYSTKATKNNLHLEQSALGAAQLFEIAGLYVDTLARIFDLQIDETLTYTAPLVPKLPQPSDETARYCTPQIS